MSLTTPVPISRPTFLGSARAPDLAALEADVAVLGLPYTRPVDLAGSRGPASLAPATLREASLEFAGEITHYDFEFGGDLFAGKATRFADCGDVAAAPGAFDANDARATDAVRAILARGAFPVVLGGDHAATLPALRAFEGRGPLCVFHFGASLDWRHEVGGVRESAGSAMRRVRELPWVVSTVHIGLRGAGAAGADDVRAALRSGATLVRAETVHAEGVEAALDVIPAGLPIYVTIDAGAFDPAIAPGVETPSFGGLTYFQVTNLLKGIAARANVVGCDLTGIVPANDQRGMTSLLGIRTVLNLPGALAHAGRLPAVATSAAQPHAPAAPSEGVPAGARQETIDGR